MSDVFDGLRLSFFDSGAIAFDVTRRAFFALEGSAATVVAARLGGYDQSDLVRFGLIDTEAAVAEVLDDLAARRAEVAAPRSSPGGRTVPNGMTACGFTLGPAHLAVRGDAVPWDGLAEALGRAPICAAATSQLELTHVSPKRVRVALDGQPYGPDPVHPDYVLTLARAAALEAAIRADPATVAAHAAAVDFRGRDVVILGENGSGKSNLVAALTARDRARMLGEDVLLLDVDGGVSVAALDVPVSLKPGAWPMLAAYGGDRSAHATFARLDGERVRYLPVARRTATRSIQSPPIFVHVRFDPGKPARLTQCRSYATACALARHLITPTRIDARGFGHLMDWIRAGEHLTLVHPGGWEGRDVLVASLADGT